MIPGMHCAGGDDQLLAGEVMHRALAGTGDREPVCFQEGLEQSCERPAIATMAVSTPSPRLCATSLVHLCPKCFCDTSYVGFITLPANCQDICNVSSTPIF